MHAEGVPASEAVGTAQAAVAETEQALATGCDRQNR
jgi:hypothetical protein